MIVVWGSLWWGGDAGAVRHEVGRPRQPERETALGILQRRYAAGELTREQFEAMKRDIL